MSVRDFDPLRQGRYSVAAVRAEAMRQVGERAPPEPDSWIYIIQRGEAGPIKIGFTRSTARRLLALQNGSAEPLRLVKLVPADRPLERQLHKQFSDYRMEGEWFRAEALPLILGCLP